MGLSLKLREKLALKQDNKCYYCDCEMNKRRPLDRESATFEHLTRIIDGGTNSASNLVIACRGCNSTRDRVPPEVWKVICKKIYNIKLQKKRLKNKSQKRIRRIAKRDNISGEELHQSWLDREAFVIPLIVKKYVREQNQIYIDHWPEGMLI